MVPATKCSHGLERQNADSHLKIMVKQTLNRSFRLHVTLFAIHIIIVQVGSYILTYIATNLLPGEYSIYQTCHARVQYMPK